MNSFIWFYLLFFGFVLIVHARHHEDFRSLKRKHPLYNVRHLLRSIPRTPIQLSKPTAVGHNVRQFDHEFVHDQKAEYESFLETLYMMRDARRHNFYRFDQKHPDLSAKTLIRPTSSQFGFRKFNFSTGVQFEEEFDCDLNLLADCESSLLAKIERIEGRKVVFTLNRTEEDEVASQFDVLQLCRSMDSEFTCLLNYAEKCEKKMRWSTFSILKYIITNNNETIVSCRQKESDWLGNDASLVEEEQEAFIDNNGIAHYLSHHVGPCISSTEVSRCMLKSFGQDFDPGRDTVDSYSRCESARHFEQCLKLSIYEQSYYKESSNDSLSCSVDEKEETMYILLSSIKLDISDESSLMCQDLQYRWNRKPPLFGIKSIGAYDGMDKATRLSIVLRYDFEALLDKSCLKYNLLDSHLPCWNRYEKRLGRLWHNEGIDHYLSSEQETTSICCITQEVNNCMGVYVLLRCGKKPYLKFRTDLVLGQWEQCAQYQYASSQCQSVLAKL